MKLYNPFKPHIIECTDGSCYIRKLSKSLFWYYLSNNYDYWWCNTNEYNYYPTLGSASVRLNSITPSKIVKVYQ